jgi:hypothetical protein
MVDPNSSLSINGSSFYQSFNNSIFLKNKKNPYRSSPWRQGIHTAVGCGVTSAAR